jgi:hypothetical protein
LPYRCVHCQTRFYRLGWRDPRRRHPHFEYSTENLNVHDARGRLPAQIPIGAPVRLAIQGQRPCAATAGCAKGDTPTDFVHGVKREVSLERNLTPARTIVRLRRRRFRRRVLVAVIGLTIIGLTAAGLVWLIETFRRYDPTYYEPKDIERERYEMQRRLPASDSPPHRSTLPPRQSGT